MAKDIECELVGVEIENLRGFRKATLSLERRTTLLVGPNNSGKTSLLRLLDWAINGATAELLEGRREMTEAEGRLLLPARDTRGAARRLVLLVRIRDGRTARRLHAHNQIARLRFRVTGNSVLVAVSAPKRSEPKSSEKAALELLAAVRNRTPLVLVPSSRSADSERFVATLGAAVRSRLAERALHARRGGAPAEYRTVKAALENLEQLASDLVRPLWVAMEDALVPGLAKVGDFSLVTEPDSLIDWLVTQIEFSLSTGEHDQRRVKPEEVGSGLQSLLDLAVMRTVEDQDSDTWLLIEEPEAFLHPSAQRSVAVSLGETEGLRRMVSTHSPLVAEEAEYGEIVLVRDHNVFEPEIVSELRAEINTSFQTGLGAEALFARSVLLVEGPGDRAFFEALRRRCARVDKSGRVNTLLAVDVGGKTRFGPWITLLRSYGADGDFPIRWLAVADSFDATTDLTRGVRAAGFTIPAAVATEIRRIPSLVQQGRVDDMIETSRAVNRAASAAGARLALASVDLEYAMLCDASQATCRKLAKRIGQQSQSRDELLRVLGSKYGRGPIAEPLKAAWMRGLIGQTIPADEISEDARSIMSMWLGGAIDQGSEIKSLLAAMR